MNCLTCDNNLNYYTKSTNCLKCQNYINYFQTECINRIPDGYFLLDEKLGIIEKCHELCKTCNKKSEIINGYVHMNCLTCLYTNKNYHPKFEGDCPDTEGKEEYEEEQETEKEEENEDDGKKDDDRRRKEDFSSKDNNNGFIWVIVIVIILIVVIIGIILYRRYKNNQYERIRNGMYDFQGQNISMEDESGIN